MSPEPVQMWIVEAGPAYQEGNTAGCAPIPVEGRSLPVGLRGLASPAREACGPDWSFVRFDAPGYPKNRLQSFYVPTRALSTKPPKPSWDKANSLSVVYSRQAGDRPTLAIPLDDPTWTAPVLLPGGEPLERLGPDVVRTQSGHELWLDPFYLGEDDPLGRRDYSASSRSVPLRRRLVEGRRWREQRSPLRELPPAESLAKARAGDVYWFSMKPAWLAAERFVADWFDPVGQTLSHRCKDPRPGEPCGDFELDYRPFGAWWPTSEVDVIAEWTGKNLVVLVTEPWSDAISVSPAWDTPPK